MPKNLKFCAARLGLMVFLIAVSLAACQRSGSQQSASQAQNAGHPDAMVTAASTVAKAVAVTPIFHRLEDAGTTFSTCNIEMVNDLPLRDEPVKVGRHGSFAIKGWVSANNLKDASFSLRLAGQGGSGLYEVLVKPSQPRPDVAKALGEASSTSGFEALVDGSSIPTGQYHIYLTATVGSSAQVCDNGRRLMVQD